MAMLASYGRLLSSAWQVSPVGRVDATHSLLRLGCIGDEESFRALCLGAVHHCLSAYCGPRPPGAAIERFAAAHVDRAVGGSADSVAAVAVPRWAEISGERTTLDVCHLQMPAAAAHGNTTFGRAESSRRRQPFPDAERCNAAVLLHATGGTRALDDLDNIVQDVLPRLAERRVPVVLAGVVDISELQGGRFAAVGTCARWRHHYVKAASQRPGHVYALDFFCAQDPWGCFNLLYRAQMSALYPLGRCFTAAGREAFAPTQQLLAAAAVIFEACDKDCDGVWARNDWSAFWEVVYGRRPSAEEADELDAAKLFGASEERLVQWFLELAAEGRGDALWACLRAFGYDGMLRRQGVGPE
mmetsp:Transcript_64866/g.180577  ORF Transcript_64866/g.180577 Transcript_64866/m.180577 type:complete len:357 (-) Transcript_64866:44-1114(-)